MLRRSMRVGAPLMAASVSLASAEPLYSVGGGGPSGNSGSGIKEKDGGMVNDVGGDAGTGTPSGSDEIDGISADTDDEDGTLCWSVDPNSTGVGGRAPIPAVNLRHQAVRRQQAGDVFLATEAWNVNSGRLPPPASLDLFDNVLVINQARGWTDNIGLGLLPNVTPFVTVPPGTPLDDVDGLASAQVGPMGTYQLYFTISNTSPAGLTLPGPGGLNRGSDIFFDPDISTGGNEQLYARGNMLGLQPGDEIDALVVFDRDDDRVISFEDVILFSLAQGSPSLDITNRSAADVFRWTPNGVDTFINHFELGLRFEDEIDALRWDRLVNGKMQDTIDMALAGLDRCPADLTASPDPNSPVYGRPDGVLDAADFFYYLDQFASGNASIADLTGSADPNDPSYGHPDGVIDASDFYYYLDLFVEGCS